MNFPRIMYHHSCLENGRIVRSQDELDSMGLGWAESPAQAEHPAEKAPELPKSEPENTEKQPEASLPPHEPPPATVEPPAEKPKKERKHK